MKKSCKAPSPENLTAPTTETEIKEELVSEPEEGKQAHLKTRTTSKTYQIKDDQVVSKKSATTSPSRSSELKIANVFRISENLGAKGGFKISDCTSQFNSDCAEIRRRSVRKQKPTEKMRDFQAAVMDSEGEPKQKEQTSDSTKPDSNQQPQQIDQMKNKTISIKTPQSINETVKLPSPAAPPSVKYQKVVLKKVDNKDNGSSHVILSPHKELSGNKLVYVKRIMQPMAGFTSNNKTITLKGGLPRDIKVVPYKNSLGTLNRDSIVIKKLPAQQLKLAQGIQLKKISLSSSNANAIQAHTSATTTTTSPSSSTKSLPQGVRVITKEHIQQKLPAASSSSKTSVKSERSNSQNVLADPRNKVDVVKNQQVTQKNEQSVQKKLEMENFYLKSALNEILEEVKGIRSKLFTLERNVRNALDDRPPHELAPAEAPTPPFKFKTEKTEANKVFKLPKLPISDLEVFEKFEQDLSYRKFYDLVYSRLANMVPTRAARRTLHRYLRFIISEDLLSSFIWDIKWMRNPTALDSRRELAKFFHFQSLLFGLVNHHKTINYPDGMKWTELESFIRSQLKNARVKKRKMMAEEEDERSHVNEDDGDEDEDDYTDTEENDSIVEAEKKNQEKTEAPQRTKSKESDKEKEKDPKVEAAKPQKKVELKDSIKVVNPQKPKTVQLTKVVTTPKTVQITKTAAPSSTTPKITPQTIKIVPSINLKNHLTLKTDDKSKKIVIVNSLRQNQKNVVLVKKPGVAGEKETMTVVTKDKNGQETEQKRKQSENEQKQEQKKQKLENDQKQQLEDDKKQEESEKEKQEEEKDPIKEEPMDHEEGGFD